ncbi:IS1 family transposase [Escherichia coli]
MASVSISCPSCSATDGVIDKRVNIINEKRKRHYTHFVYK